MKKLQYHLNCRVVESSAFLIFPGGRICRSCLLRSDSFSFGWCHYILPKVTAYAERNLESWQWTSYLKYLGCLQWMKYYKIKRSLDFLLQRGCESVMLRKQVLQSCLKVSSESFVIIAVPFDLLQWFLFPIAFKTKKFIKTRLWPKETWQVYWLLFCVTLTSLFALVIVLFIIGFNRRREREALLFDSMLS